MSLLRLQFAAAEKLFDFYAKQGMYDQAMPIGNNLLVMMEKIEGPDSFATAELYAKIADFHFDDGYDYEAERMYNHSLIIANRAGNVDKNYLFYTMQKRGASLEKLSRIEDAAEMYQICLTLAGFHWDLSHPTFDELKASLQRCGGAPDTAALKLMLTPEELEAERRDRAVMQMAALMNQQMGTADQSMRTETPEAIRVDTELEYWAMAGNTGKVKLSLLNGQNVNERWHEGKTALHTAARFNRVEVIKLLLSAGADPNAKLASGETPLDLAIACGSEGAAAVLYGR